MLLTRAEIIETFRTSKVDSEGVFHFYCKECGCEVDGATHPKMQQVLINHFNDEVSRSLENKIKIRVSDPHAIRAAV